ncbi:LysE family translocator [Aquimarina mytili]|uniref:LysE family translocator n=1 Tax=Aquimarina mytili TaxID=874423 RepID=A0A936ZY16_9FLAO|nr:LysE family translocator [Aquimarina mytili]MBL0684396.1 LysE family translocator [Aquimarina mytili]
MNTTLWISFIGTVLVIGITPGPSVLLASANSMNHGAKKTLGTILGDLSANSIQIVLSSLGLASIVISSGEIFGLIKWAGVGYLLYMGVIKIITAPKIGKFKKNNTKKGFLKLYSEGFLMSASNPKAIVFFAALFPLFIDQNLAFAPQVVVLGITYLVIDGICLLLYVNFASRLKKYLEDREKVHLQNRIIGALLIFSGFMLSMVNRSNN